jgi:hypothetical protein
MGYEWVMNGEKMFQRPWKTMPKFHGNGNGKGNWSKMKGLLKFQPKHLGIFIKLACTTKVSSTDHPNSRRSLSFSAIMIVPIRHLMVSFQTE